MKRVTMPLRALGVVSSLSLGWLPQLGAQAAATPAAPASANSDDETIELSPFVVQGEEDSGYAAKNTLAGTRIRTELKDVGSSISVVTQKFLQDTNSKNLTELMVYTPSTEVSGQGGNYLGMGANTYLTGAASGASLTTRVRGLAQADNTRDFFLTDIPFDSYNVARVEIQRGPNAILFGIGSPAGIVNTTLNQASFRNSYQVENQVDNFGTVRFSGDFNRVVLPQELAVRVSLLADETKYRQDPAFKSDQRGYAALRYDPKFLSQGSARTSFTATFETGDINRNDPINTPPLDAITPWFNAYSAAQRAQGFSAAFVTPEEEAARGFYLGNGQVTAASDPWLGAPGNRVFDGTLTMFNGASQGPAFATQVKNWPGNGADNPANVLGANTWRGITTYNSFAANAQLRGSTIGGFKSRSLTDPSIFNFYDHLLPGPNQEQYNKFNAFNAALRQTFLSDTLGLELAYNRQESRFGQNNFVNNDATSVAIDIMRTLIDGTPNPNFQRPVVYAGPGGFAWTDSEREDIRLTAFAELDFNKISGKDSMVAKIFGRNVFTGLASQQKTDLFTGNGPRYFIDAAFPPALAAGAINQASRNDIFAVYLGAPVTGSTASGIDLTGIKDRIVPAPGQTVNYYNNATQAWERLDMPVVNNDLTDDRGKVYTGSRLTADKVESSAFVWQGYWFDGTIIPMFGYRKDKDTFRDAGNAPSLGQGMVDPFSPSFQLGNPIQNEVRSKTYSLVTHLPNSWRRNLPGNLDISLYYNQSENFKPDSSRRDLLGNSIANPAGETEEYGVAITALDDRLTLKVTRYETKVANATLSGNIGNNYYLIGAVETWGQAAAIAFRNSMEPGGPLSGPASTLYGYTSDGHQVTWHPDEATPDNPDPNDPNRGYSQAALDAIYLRERASVDAWLSPAQQVPASFQQAWGMSDYATGGQAQNFGAAGVAVTGDTLSKGTEVELIANPIKGLDVSINVSKTFATQTNLAKSYVDWINDRYDQFLNTPAGEMRLWGGDDDSQSPARDIYGSGGETARGKFTRETMSNYWLWQALEGSNVPELRPWRANITANYAFQSERFNGLNLGGAYRWQSAAKTGFPVVGTGTGADPFRFDVGNPYEGSDEGILDGWIGYRFKFAEKFTWRVQLNVRNIFAKDGLQRVTVQPDGSPAGYRIQEPRTFILTNSISF